MTLDRLQGCCKYSLLGVVIGGAIASSGGYAFAQTPSPSCPPGQVCIREKPPLPPHGPNPPARIIRIEELVKRYPQAIRQLQQEDPQAIQKLRQNDQQTVIRLQQLEPNSIQQIQR